MSVSSIIGGGIRLVRTQPHIIAIWSAIYLAVMAVAMVVFMPAMSAILAEQRQAAANAAMGVTTPPSFHAGMFLGLLVFEIIVFLIMLILFAATVRAVAQPEGDRFAYLRLGMDELRLIGLGVIFVLAGFAIEIVAIIGLALIGGLLVVAAGKGAAVLIGALLGFLLFGAAIYAQIRLSLTGAFTVMRHRIVIKDAWRATKGHFWTLFGSYLLISLAFLIITIVLVAITNPHLLAAYASVDPLAINAAVQEQMARQSGLSVGLIIQMIVGAPIFTIMLAIAFGAIATAAVEMADPPGSEI